MRREYKISIRITGNEREALRVIARRESLKMSEVIRLLIRESTEKRGLWKSIPILPEKDEIISGEETND